MNGRAITPEQKRAVVERLLAAWLVVPEQRLGQLICNGQSASHVVDVFYVEDEQLIRACEQHAAAVVAARKERGL